MIIVFFPTPQRYIPLRNDQNKIADILQECKGYIHFCHRFPVTELNFSRTIINNLITICYLRLSMSIRGTFNFHPWFF